MRDYPFELSVYIYTRPNLRDDSLEMEMFMGRGVLESLYDRMEVRKDVKSLFLSFPEHWLNITEQRQLFERLAKYCPNLKEVDIKTHSVYIIQCTPNKCAYMMDETIPEHTDGKHYHDGSMGGNLFDMSKLNVVGGSVAQSCAKCHGRGFHLNKTGDVVIDCENGCKRNKEVGRGEP